MRFVVSVSAALAALASSVLAQSPTSDFDAVTEPQSGQNITAGTTFTLKWSTISKYSSGTITISLIGGDEQAKQNPIGGPIATGVPNSAGTYDWAVDSSLGDLAFYGLQFFYDSNKTIFQYSNPFHIIKSESGSSGNGTATVTSTSGTVTVSLTSATTTSAPSPAGNLSITSTTPAKTTVTAKVTGATNTPNGAAQATAGALVALGGLALAALAL